MTTAWLVVVLTGMSTLVIKGAGPALLGGRPLPVRLVRLVGLLAPALLAALVVTQVVGDGRHLTLDARIAGLAVAGIAVWRKAPVLVVVVLAAATTAAVRAIF